MEKILSEKSFPRESEAGWPLPSKYAKYISDYRADSNKTTRSKRSCTTVFSNLNFVVETLPTWIWLSLGLKKQGLQEHILKRWCQLSWSMLVFVPTIFNDEHIHGSWQTQKVSRSLGAATGYRLNCLLYRLSVLGIVNVSFTRLWH